MLENINISKLKEIVNNVKIIDIRSREHYNDNHIPNAINIQSKELMDSPKRYLNWNEKYYIYCQKGITSVKVCADLCKLGFKVINIQGGYEEWILES